MTRKFQDKIIRRTGPNPAQGNSGVKMNRNWELKGRWKQRSSFHGQGDLVLAKPEDFQGEVWSQCCCTILGKSDIADTYILDVEHVQLWDKSRLFLSHLL